MKDKLEIIIPTYNRVKNLTQTLDQLLAETSPVKNCLITILDNCSDDDTQKYCAQVQNRNQNIKYVRHEKNIGMGANITRAMEIASKPYYWLIGDDDNYDFTAWSEVEEAMAQESDCIVVADFTMVDDTLASKVGQLGLLSAGIYKTENVTADVLQNAYANIVNMFPHMALICDLVNKKGSFYATKSPIALWGISNPDPKGYAYIRGAKKVSNLCPRLKKAYLLPASFNCFEMIIDESERTFFINNLHKLSKLTKHLSFFDLMSEQIMHNKLLFNNDEQNVYDLYRQLNFNNKVTFISAYLYVNLIKYPMEKHLLVEGVRRPLILSIMREIKRFGSKIKRKVLNEN